MEVFSFPFCILGRKFLDDEKIFQQFSDSPAFKREVTLLPIGWLPTVGQTRDLL